MITKIKAARVLMVAGIPMVICYGRQPHVVEDAAAGKAVGTRFSALEKPHEITPRKLWIALGDSARGAVVVDEGAKSALIGHGKSLLCVALPASRVVSRPATSSTSKTLRAICSPAVARRSPLTRWSLACGKTHEVLERNRLLAALTQRPLVHRDELVVFEYLGPLPCFGYTTECESIMLEQEVLAVAQAAKNASPALAQATAQERNAALTAMARALRDRPAPSWPPRPR